MEGGREGWREGGTGGREAYMYVDYHALLFSHSPSLFPSYLLLHPSLPPSKTIPLDKSTYSY